MKKSPTACQLFPKSKMNCQQVAEASNPLQGDKLPNSGLVSTTRLPHQPLKVYWQVPLERRRGSRPPISVDSESVPPPSGHAAILLVAIHKLNWKSISLSPHQTPPPPSLPSFQPRCIFQQLCPPFPSRYCNVFLTSFWF